MKSGQLFVRIDPATLEGFRSWCCAAGMNASEGVRALIRDELRRERELAARNVMTERELERCFDASVLDRDMARMFGLDGTWSEAEMMDALTLGEVER